jgi:hypothetical protein
MRLCAEIRVQARFQTRSRSDTNCWNGSSDFPPRSTWGIAYVLYPRIHRWESVSRRAVGSRWHDDVACTIVYIYDNLLFLEVRLEVATSVRVVNGKQ